MTCPLCESALQPALTEVVAVQQDAHLLYVRCRHCATGSIAIVTARPDGIQAVGALTDLTLSEVLDQRGHPPVSEDDVIEFASALSIEPNQLTLFQR